MRHSFGARFPPHEREEKSFAAEELVLSVGEIVALLVVLIARDVVVVGLFVLLDVVRLVARADPKLGHAVEAASRAVTTGGSHVSEADHHRDHDGQHDEGDAMHFNLIR